MNREQKRVYDIIYYQKHKSKKKEADRIRNQKNKAKNAERMRIYRAKHREACRLTVRKSYQKNIELRRSYDKKRYLENPELRKGYETSRRLREKYEALMAYGGVFCKCCGESDISVLTLDHIRGDGDKHRQEIKKLGSKFYRWLAKNNYPKEPELQVLCMNCNFAKKKSLELPSWRKKILLNNVKLYTLHDYSLQMTLS